MLETGEGNGRNSGGDDGEKSQAGEESRTS